MTAIKFPEANAKIGSEEAGVYSLPILKGSLDGGPLDGAEIFISAWLPTAEELVELNNGQPVYLHCIHGQPPVTLATKILK